MILYFCPDQEIQSSGMRCLYRHVAILRRHNFDARILHQRAGFVLREMPDVPIEYLDQVPVVEATDVVVIPEGVPDLMKKLRDFPLRRFVFAQSWTYIYAHMPPGEDWRDYDVERVMVLSEFIGNMVAWAMNLPVHQIGFGIKRELYRHDAKAKQKKIVYIERKGALVPLLKGILRSRNPAYIQQIEWRGLSGLSEAEYANEVGTASIFLNLSLAEGLMVSCLEAMRAGAIVGGFTSIAGADTLIGDGDQQNCVLAETGDYITLAMRLAPLLDAILAGGLAPYQYVIRNARRTSSPYTKEFEEESLVEFWAQAMASENSAT